MKAAFRAPAAVVLCFWTAACGGSAGEEDRFVVPAEAVKIGNSEIYLPGGEPATLPMPSSSDTAPRITGVTAMATGTFTFEVHLEVESAAPVGFVYFDFGDAGVFRAQAQRVTAGGDPPITACGVAAEAQGITCTEACLAACSCLTCPEGQVELEAEQACALTCTIWDDSGAIDTAPYNGSEDAFAYYLYSGLPEHGVAGVAESLGCGVDACSEPLPPEQPRIQSWAVGFTAPEIPSATPIFASQITTSDAAPQASNPAAAASVRICPQGAMACR